MLILSEEEDLIGFSYRFTQRSVSPSSPSFYSYKRNDDTETSQSEDDEANGDRSWTAV